MAPEIPQKKNEQDDAILLGLILTLLASLCFSLQGIITKLAFAEGVTLTTLLFYRKLIFLPFLWAYCLIRLPKQQVFPEKRNIMIAIATGVVGYFVVPMLSFGALKFINANIERIILYTFPLFVILFTAMLERKVPARKHIAVFVITQIGIFLLMGGGSDMLHTNLIGALLVLAASIIMGGFVIMTQVITRKVGTIIFILWALTGASLAIAIQSIFLWPSNSLVLNAKGFSLVMLLIFFSFPPAIMFSEGIKRIGGSRAALISGAAPLMTIFFAYMILDEVLYPSQLLGATIIILAIVLLEKRAIGVLLKRKKKVII